MSATIVLKVQVSRETAMQAGIEVPEDQGTPAFTLAESLFSLVINRQSEELEVYDYGPNDDGPERQVKLKKADVLAMWEEIL